MILIINGPNLNMLGKREPTINGNETYTELVRKLINHGENKNVEITIKQSNHEGDIIDWIQEASGIYKGIIINPGAFTHYSYAILDALKSIELPVIEVHISNIYARETYRSHSVTAAAVCGVITGLGTDGYKLAIDSLISKIDCA